MNPGHNKAAGINKTVAPEVRPDLTNNASGNPHVGLLPGAPVPSMSVPPRITTSFVIIFRPGISHESLHGVVRLTPTLSIAAP